MKARRLVITAITATALAAGGTAYALADDSPGTRASASTAAARTAADRTADASPGITAARAAAIAEKAAGGTALSADLDDDGAAAWDVDVRTANGTWHEVEVSADSGEVRKDEKDDEGEDDAPAAAPARTLADAAAAAEKHTPGTVVSVELDGTAWEAEVRTADGKVHDLTVDDRTGKVTKDRTDTADDDHEADDDRDDTDTDD